MHDIMYSAFISSYNLLYCMHAVVSFVLVFSIYDNMFKLGFGNVLDDTDTINA